MKGGTGADAAREDLHNNGDLHACPYGEEAGGAEQSHGRVVLARAHGHGGRESATTTDLGFVPFLCPFRCGDGCN